MPEIRTAGQRFADAEALRCSVNPFELCPLPWRLVGGAAYSDELQIVDADGGVVMRAFSYQRRQGCLFAVWELYLATMSGATATPHPVHGETCD